MTPLEAMKQAIDALEDAMSYFAYPMYRKQCADLQKALEEMEKAKPVAYLYGGWQLLTPDEVEERNKEYDRNSQEYDEQVPLYHHPAPIPEGWQLVPVEPTDHMREEGRETYPDDEYQQDELANALSYANTLLNQPQDDSALRETLHQEWKKGLRDAVRYLDEQGEDFLRVMSE